MLRFVLALVLATFANAQTLSVPANGLADEPLRVRLDGFAPGTPVILRASAEDAAKTRWISWMGATAPGEIDASALIGSMDVAGADHGRVRFAADALDALRLTITAEVDGRVVATANATRRFRGDGVTCEAIRDERVIGTLCRPAAAPRANVLLIGGSEGGIADEGLAALLASHGYAVLAVAFFGAPGLPDALAEIPLERFFAAIDLLRERAGAHPVVLFGTSKGAEAALLVALHRRDVKGVVAYAPSSVAWSCICADDKSSWTLGGKPLPFVAAGRDPLYAPPPGFPLRPGVHYAHRLRSAPAAARIAANDISARLLLVAGGDDQMWPSLAMAQQLAAVRHRRHDVMLTYPRAGHLIGKLLLPAGSTRVANGRLETGGSPEANAQAQRDSWPRVLQFLEESSR